MEIDCEIFSTVILFCLLIQERQLSVSGEKMCTTTHYTPIQIYRKFHLQKLKIFRYKNSDIFHISAQNIDCGYSLELPRRGSSNEYPQSIF